MRLRNLLLVVLCRVGWRAGFIGFSLVSVAVAQPAPANHDESRVPAYTLPDPLVGDDGSAVRNATDWNNRRRGELLERFSAEMYGRTPRGRPDGFHWETTAVDRAALGGKATRKEVTVWFTARRDGPQLHLLILQPNPEPGAASPARWPVFLGLNFFGNHTVHADPGIALAHPFTHYDAARYRPSAAGAAPAGDPEQRGVDAPKWQVETVLARGYATVTAYRADLCPDEVGGLNAGAAAAYGTGGTEERADDAWGAVGTWAWGLSRALDVIAADPELDATRVAVHGFSRLGKAADWAAAQDGRFALLVSFQSGCGGAALSKRLYGETVAIINKNFPHWFAKRFRFYNDNETALPFDQHALLALVAPRPVLIGSAVEDRWSDPRGEFLAARHASPVWALWGEAGIDVAEPPAAGAQVGARVSYYLRSGKHDVTVEDWARALDFADRYLKSPAALLDAAPANAPAGPGEKAPRQTGNRD